MGGHEKYASFNGKQNSCVLLAKPSAARGGAPVVTEASADTKGRGGASGERQPPAGDKPKGIYAPRAPLLRGVHEGPFSKLRDDGAGKTNTPDRLTSFERAVKRRRSSGDDRTSWTDGRRRGCFAEGASI